jgi:predicted nucleic acid-binding protein
MAQPMTGLIGWIERNSDRLYLSIVIVAEVEASIANARRQSLLSRGHDRRSNRRRHNQRDAGPVRLNPDFSARCYGLGSTRN